MEIQLLEGFDQVPGASDVRATLTSLGYAVPGAGEIAWGGGRSAGSQAVSLEQAVSTVAVSRTVDFLDTLVTGFAVNVTERAQLVSVNGTDLVVGWDDGGLHLRDQVSVAKPIRDRWYYIELELDKLALECRVYINGSLDMTAPLPDSLETADTVALQLAGVNPTNEAGQPPPSSGVVESIMRYDDWYVSDERMGPLEVRTRFATADVVTDWSTPTGAGPHYPEVSQQPPTDSRYITSFETGAVDEFTSDTALPVDADVLAVAVTARARKGDIDTRALGIRFDGQEQIQTSLTLDSQWYVKFFPAPAGTPWTAAQIEAATFGVAVR